MQKSIVNGREQLSELFGNIRMASFGEDLDMQGKKYRSQRQVKWQTNGGDVVTSDRQVWKLKHLWKNKMSERQTKTGLEKSGAGGYTRKSPPWRL